MQRATIFDIDGTLVDSVDLHAKAWQEALAHFGYEVPFQEIRDQIGKGGDQLLPVFVPKQVLDERQDEIEAWRGNHYKRYYMPQVRPFPFVRELFERLLAAGQQLALASSAKKDELDHYKQLARIDDLVTGETSADDVERSKPHPDVFHAAMNRLEGVEPKQVLVVGDSPYDAEAAGKAGLRTVGVLCGGFPAPVLREAGCIELYRDPAHLLEELERSPLTT